MSTTEVERVVLRHLADMARLEAEITGYALDILAADLAEKNLAMHDAIHYRDEHQKGRSSDVRQGLHAVAVSGIDVA